MNLLHQVITHMRAGHWREAHNLVQEDGSELAAWLHGILHIQEGDLEDAEYWYGKANRHFRGRGTLDEELARFEAALSDRRQAGLSEPLLTPPEINEPPSLKTGS